MAPFTVQSVAFGSVPVEATIEISQRFEDGMPVPLTPTTTDENYASRDQPPAGRTEFMDSTIDEQLVLSISSVKVDGVDLDIVGTCTTVEPARLLLVGKGFWQYGPGTDEKPGYPNSSAVDRDRHFDAVNGGTLNGHIEVPPFVDCVTSSGEDISPLLTVTASGDENPVQARAGIGICIPSVPPLPGRYTLEEIWADTEATCLPHASSPPPDGDYYPYPERPAE